MRSLISSGICSAGICALLLGGCATLTAEECTTANWQQLGYTDAVEGHPATRLGQHYEACAEHGITPNNAQYEIGHAEGARVYCDPENAFRLGNAGTTPASFCPADMAVIFNDNYAAGRGLHDRRAAVNQSRDAIYRAERDLDAMENRASDLQYQLAYGTPAQAQRNAIVTELEDIRQDRSYLRNNLRRFRDDLRDRQYDYDSYKSSIQFVVIEPGS